jgi:protein-glutamine gamma-glutamyltransferase
MATVEWPPTSMARKRPQLNSDDLGRLRWGMGALLALLSVVTVFFMDIDAWLLMPLVTIAAIMALVRPTWPAKLPKLVHRLAFPFIALAFVYDLVSSEEPLPALIRLAMLLIFYRLITYRQRRDDLQLVLLGLFLVVVAGVITVSLSFAVQLLAFTSCALVMLLAVTLEHADGSSPPAYAPGVVPSWARGTWRNHFSRLRTSTDWRLAALGMGAFGGLVVLSGLLFLAIPRFDIQSSLFIDRLISRTTMSGFSEDIRFGDVTSITQDDSLAFSVDLTDPSAMPLVPYWRMVVLDEYTGEGFRLSSDFRRTLNGFSVPRNRVLGTNLRPDYNAPSWTIYMEPGISRYLPLLGNFYSMTFTEPQTFSVSDQLRIVALQREPPKMFAYRTWNMDTRSELYDPTFALEKRDNPSIADPFLTLPDAASDQVRLRELLTEVSATPMTDAREFGSRVINWLEDIHPYALSSSVPPGEGDTLIRWLDSEAAGHCEFFAGSFVMLARAAGFPARVVTGFRGGSWNDFSGSFMVRNSNAHAWAEVFDDTSNAWIRFDPTPGNQALADLSDQADSAAALAAARDQSWNARLESLRVFWYRRIVNFDLQTQEQLVSSTKAFFQEKSQAIIAWTDARIAEVRGWVMRPWDLSRIGQIMALLGGGALLIWGWRRMGSQWWFALRRSTNRKSHHDPVRKEASRWLQRGAKRAEFSWPPELQSELLRLRFGDSDKWPDPLHIFRAARTALKSGR